MAKRTRKSSQASQKARHLISDIPPSLPIALAHLTLSVTRGRITGDLIAQWNKATEQLTGFKHRQVSGKPISGFLEENNRASVFYLTPRVPKPS